MTAKTDKKKLLARMSALAVAVSVSAFMLPAMLRYAEEWSGRLEEFRIASLALAFAISLVVRPLTAIGWQFVLAAFGHRLPWRKAMRIWLVAESCRWLPGGVWHFGSRAVQSSALGMPLPVAVASMGLELLLMVVASLVLAVAGMIVYGSQQTAKSVLAEPFFIAAATAVALPLLALAAYWPLRRVWPEKLNALRDRMAGLRQVRPQPLPTAVCFVFYIFLGAVNGVAFYATAIAVSPESQVPLFAAIAANSLAWVVGLIAVVTLVPAGLGIREGALILQMSIWLGVGDAVVVAVLWRVLLLAVELVWVLVACGLPPIVRACLLTTEPRTDKPKTCLEELGECK